MLRAEVTVSDPLTVERLEAFTDLDQHALGLKPLKRRSAVTQELIERLVRLPL
jgi:hypothetical protein